MKIIYSKHIPFKNFISINFVWFIIVRKEYEDDFTEVDYNHECIHSSQQKELLIIIFFIWYIFEYIIKLIYYRDKMKAYYNISFEREADANDKNFEYLKTRKYFAFIKYIIK